MSQFQLVSTDGWEVDLHSIYTGYMAFFESRKISWWEKSWGPLFNTFEDFLNFGWPVIVVTDSWTNKPHIVTRSTSLGAFLKTIKTRYGETLPVINDTVHIYPFETQQRPLRTVNDLRGYTKLFATLPAAVLSALKTRVKSGEPAAIRHLWAKKEHTFLAIDFEWLERNNQSCLEFGYATLRCGYINDIMGTWPPKPADHYRCGHYIVEEYLNIPHKKRTPVVPWEYAWGESQVVPKSKLPVVIQGLICSLASPESETVPNDLVLVAHGISGDLDRLNDLQIKIPKNIVLLDTATFERHLFSSGFRGEMKNQQGNLRQQGSTLSLGNTLGSFGLQSLSTLHNAGNDAYMCLLALQLLLEPTGVDIPVPTRRGKPNLSQVYLPDTMHPGVYGLSEARSSKVSVNETGTSRRHRQGTVQARPSPARNYSAPLPQEFGLLVPPSNGHRRSYAEASMKRSTLA